MIGVSKEFADHRFQRPLQVPVAGHRLFPGDHNEIVIVGGNPIVGARRSAPAILAGLGGMSPLIP